MKYIDLLEPKIENQALYQDDSVLPSFNIVTEQARYPLRNLNEIFKSHNLNPSYQRGQVWDDKRKSKLIESFIINIPVPSIFLYETENASYEVMDGKQRVSSILDFYNDRFRLCNLEIWTDINGKFYSELDSNTKRMIDRRYISATILLSESAETLKDQAMLKQIVFERLNTGGLSLSAQETRNALYQGLFNESLTDIADSEMFKLLIPVKSDDMKRMEDCELVLRFFAYRSACKYGIAKGIKLILDKFAESACDLNENDVQLMEKEYIRLLKTVYNLFGQRAFFSSLDKGNYEKMIYDTVMLSCAQALDEGTVFKFDSTAYEMKCRFIKENKTLFNGKHTSISSVIERVKVFKNGFLANYYE